MDPKLVEELHETASNAYLQGDVEGALSAWRRVLELDPTDERAIEGVDLCERMSGCESASVVTTGQSPFAVGAGPGSPEPSDTNEPPDDLTDPLDDLTDPLDDLTDPLDHLLDMGATPPPPQADSTGPPEPEPAEETRSLFDFSDLRDDAGSSDDRDEFDVGELLSGPTGDLPAPDAGGIPESLFDDDLPSAPSIPQAEPESTWHFGVGPEPADPVPPEPVEEQSFGVPPEPSAPAADAAAGPFVDPPPEVGAGEVAAAGLHRRVSDLLATALAEMERGDRELALMTLDRLLILDEDNEAARSLKQKLTAEVDVGGAEQANTDEADDCLEMEDEAGESLELQLGDAEEAEIPSEATAEPMADMFVDDFAPPTEAEPQTGEVVPRGKRFGLPAIPVSKKIWVPVAAVIVLGLGFVLWNTFFSGGEVGAETGVPVSQGERPEDTGRKPKPDKGEAQPPVNNDAAKSAEERLAEILQQADTLLAEADYAAAIVSFNAALQLDPENAELRKRLESAGESYRIQQENQKRWTQAVEDFDGGNYRAALAYFYRLPDEEHTEVVNRYILNGWYNLGVTALKNRECKEALEHLGEARRLDSGDAGVLEAVDLAVRCKREGSAEIQASAVALQYRELEDSP